MCRPSGLAESPVAYHHIRLTECFPDVEDLLYEHVLVTTASSDRDDELNDIIENRLAIDRVIENVQVCVLTSDIIQKLRRKPDLAAKSMSRHSIILKIR